MSGPIDTLTYADIEAAELGDWRLMLSALHTRFRTGGFTQGLALVNAVGEVAEELDHHPDLDLRYGHLDIRLTSHDAGGVTERDVALARRITELAAGLGAVAEPGAVQVLELGLDTPDHRAVRPFWQAVPTCTPWSGSCLTATSDFARRPSGFSFGKAKAISSLGSSMKGFPGRSSTSGSAGRANRAGRASCWRTRHKPVGPW